jgi:hypothetical protein
VPDGDKEFAQYIYLANMYAQKGECKCDACQLLRKSTEGMINMALKGLGGGLTPDLARIAEHLGVQGKLDKVGEEEVTQ